MFKMFFYYRTDRQKGGTSQSRKQSDPQLFSPKLHSFADNGFRKPEAHISDNDLPPSLFSYNVLK